MDPAIINLAWFAAPILAQRNIELSAISHTFGMFDGSHVFSMTATDGTIGSFRIPVLEFASARTILELTEVLACRLRTVEFTHDGKPPFLELQPSLQDASEDTADTQAAPDPIDEDGSGVETQTDEGVSGPTPAT